MDFVRRRCLLITMLMLSFLMAGPADAQRKLSGIQIPDIAGYKTLKCDLHMHTVFSDGRVWPTIRVQEAQSEGLDAIAITDHIKHSLLWKTGLVSRDSLDFNLSYELAQKEAEGKNVTVIHAAEITRGMPPGHLNALFLNDVNALNPKQHPDWKTAVETAHKQGGFVFWNHPSWPRQAPEGLAKWYKGHSEMYKNGWLNGIEVVNGGGYSPEAHQWCIDKKLTMVGNSDTHGVPALYTDFQSGQHRTMTLVFAKENTVDAIKEALFNRRTVVYTANVLIGDAAYLHALLKASLEVTVTKVEKHERLWFVNVKNTSGIDYTLSEIKNSPPSGTAGDIVLKAGETAWFGVRAKAKDGKIKLPYEVRNLIVAPEKRLQVDLVGFVVK